MKVYEKSITVKPGDLDDLNHVNNVRYVQWIQDISKEHWQSVALPSWQQGFHWVVRNHNISYKNSAVLNDTIRISTHIKETKGTISVRYVEMFNVKTQRLLVNATTEWCLISANTLKPLRVSKEIIGAFE